MVSSHGIQSTDMHYKSIDQFLDDGDIDLNNTVNMFLYKSIHQLIISLSILKKQNNDNVLSKKRIRNFFKKIISG